MRVCLYRIGVQLGEGRNGRFDSKVFNGEGAPKRAIIAATGFTMLSADEQSEVFDKRIDNRTAFISALGSMAQWYAAGAKDPRFYKFSRSSTVSDKMLLKEEC